MNIYPFPHGWNRKKLLSIFPEITISHNDHIWLNNRIRIIPDPIDCSSLLISFGSRATKEDLKLLEKIASLQGYNTIQGSITCCGEPTEYFLNILNIYREEDYLLLHIQSSRHPDDTKYIFIKTFLTEFIGYPL